MLRIGLAYLAIMLCTCQAASSLHPLIIIPGSGGNQVEARLTSEYKPTSLVCNRWYPLFKQKGGWFRIWFDPSVVIAPFTKCFADRMKLYYDKDLDDYVSVPGIETRVPHFGSTEALISLDPHLKHLTAYMGPIVKSLEQIGYVNGESLFGAPYDFRYGITSKVGSKFMQDLKQLIEKASDLNEGKPVILLTHSLGGLFALQLLIKNSVSWKRHFIKHLVALAAPWAGSIDLMRTFASGNTLGLPFVDPLLARAYQRTAETNLWLLPNPNIFRAKRLVVTANDAYTSYDIAQFLEDIGFAEGVYPYKTRVLPLMEMVVPPEIPVTCIIGSGVKTTERLVYRGNGFDEEPEIEYGDGDGTVNMESLLALETFWGDDYKQNQSLKIVRINGVSHTSMLRDDIAIDEIIAEISCINYNAMATALR